MKSKRRLQLAIPLFPGGKKRPSFQAQTSALEALSKRCEELGIDDTVGFSASIGLFLNETDAMVSPRSEQQAA